MRALNVRRLEGGHGYWAAGALGIAAYGSLGGFVISLVGALILIAILRALGVFQ